MLYLMKFGKHNYYKVKLTIKMWSEEVLRKYLIVQRNPYHMGTIYCIW